MINIFWALSGITRALTIADAKSTSKVIVTLEYTNTVPLALPCKQVETGTQTSRNFSTSNFFIVTAS